MFRNGLISAMEEVENELPVDQQEAADTAVAVADETAEIQQDSGEIDVSVSQVEDAVQAGDELESIGEVAADAVESGEGLSEETAEMASIAIESIRNRLGFRSETRLVPATESFGNTNTRLMSTKLVIEGITDTLKKIWNAIKSAILRLKDKLVSFFSKLFNSAAMLAKHIKMLQDRANKMPASLKMVKKTIKSSSARAFSLNGKADFDTAKKVINNTALMSAVALATAAKQKDVSAAAQTLAASDITADSVEKFLSAQNAGADAVVKAASTFVTMDPTLAQMPAKANKNGKGTANYAYGPFVGSKVLHISVSETEVLGKPMKRASVSFIDSKGKIAEEIGALEMSEIKEVLATAAKMCSDLQDFKKVQGEYDAITKASNKLAETVMSSAVNVLEKSGAKQEVSAGLKALQSEVSSSLSSLSSFGNVGPNLVFNAVKSLADYASLSLANLK